MLIYAIDDEPNMLYLLHEAIAEAVPEAEIVDFLLGADAIASIEKNHIFPDVVFSDIRMPGLSGLELAAKLKDLSRDTKVIFVTGYDYAMDAYQLHVRGYIPKPVEAERIREELDDLFSSGGDSESDSEEKLRIQCFGTFEVFWQNKPVLFSRRRTKELLAYLVDRRGALCSSDEIMNALWEDQPDSKSARHRMWNLTSDLRNSLKAIGMEQVLISQGQQFAVRTTLVDCDYYRFLEGNPAAIRSFQGEYMEQYSWAEATKGSLIFSQDNQ